MNKLKKILGLIAVLLIAVVAAWNVSFGSQTKGMTDVMLANVEALADYEGDFLDCVYYCVYDFNYICSVYKDLYGIGIYTLTAVCDYKRGG